MDNMTGDRMAGPPKRDEMLQCRKRQHLGMGSDTCPEEWLLVVRLEMLHDRIEYQARRCFSPYSPAAGENKDGEAARGERTTVSVAFTDSTCWVSQEKEKKVGAGPCLVSSCRAACKRQSNLFASVASVSEHMQAILLLV